MLPQTRSFYSSQPEIFRNNNAHRYANALGRKWLLESDFPVLVSFDGVLTAGVHSRFGGNLRFDTPGLRDEAQVSFSFPVGHGVNNAGALVQAEVLGGSRRGICRLTSAWSDEAYPEPIDPQKLPHTCFLLESGLIAAADATPPQTLTQTVDKFHLPDFDIAGSTSYLPEAIYVTGVAVSRETLTSLPTVGSYIYEWQLQQFPVVANDDGFYIIAKGATPSYHVPFNHHKIPLRGCYQPWAAETPLLETVNWHDSDPAISVVVVAINCAYLPALL